MKTKVRFVFRIYVLLFVMMAAASLCFAQFAGGDGSMANPYRVTNADELNSVRNYLGANFVQTAYINLAADP